MRIISAQQIKAGLDLTRALALQEEGFRLYSRGLVEVPPVGYLDFGPESGEVHIKCGWIRGEAIFAVKVAGAFHQNAKSGASDSSTGIILVFNAKTGKAEAILSDQGYLTDIRTALAGLIAAKYLGPQTVSRIGVLGTGVQARLQAELLKEYTECRELMVWGRNEARVAQYMEDMADKGFQVTKAPSVSELAEQCNLIVTTTAARQPLLHANDVRPGTHITAVGADAPGKQELDAEIFRRADLSVVDAKSQCLDHGESRHAVLAGLLSENDLVELGEVITDKRFRRKDDKQITICDLTGIGVQDVQIAKAVL